ncbi:MAG TPA: hypothetical protein VGP08_02315 [Pyrinomonadaceae bacterium]|jgi:hypothetical protein|nr:hypothetical protein [Pyrinomonadaceae bacterium]
MTERKSNTEGGAAGLYCEVRQTSYELADIGIPQGAAVALIISPSVDYEPGDVVLARERAAGVVGRLMVFEGVTEDGARIRLARIPSSDIGTFSAHRIELRGRAVRSAEERGQYQPRGMTGEELTTHYYRVLRAERASA